MGILRHESILVLLENFQTRVGINGYIDDPYLEEFIVRMTTEPVDSTLLIVTTHVPKFNPQIQHDLIRQVIIDKGLDINQSLGLLSASGLDTLSPSYLSGVSQAVKGLPAALVQIAALVRVGGRPVELKEASQHILASLSEQLLDSLRPPERKIIAAAALSRLPLPLSSLAQIVSDEEYITVVEAFLRLSNQFLLVEFSDSDYAIGVHDSLRIACKKQIASNEQEEFHKHLRSYYYTRYEQGRRDSRFLIEAIFHAIQAREFNWAIRTLSETTEDRIYRRGLIKECAELLEQLSDITDDPELSFLYGLIEQTRGHYTSARGLYNRALEKSLSDVLICRINHQLATIERMIGNMQQARRILHKNCIACKRTHNYEGLARSMYQLAIWMRETGRIVCAQRYLSKALDIYVEQKSKRGVAKVKIQLAKIDFLFGQWSNAIRQLYDAEELGVALNDPDVIATAQHQLGNANHYLSIFDEAERHYDRSRVLRENMDDIRGVAAIYHQMGFLRLKQGRISEAIELVHKSEHLWDAVENRQGRALNLTLRACLAYRQGLTSEAIRFYKKALDGFEFLADKLNLARLLILGTSILTDCEEGAIARQAGTKILSALAPGETPFSLDLLP
jgi:tetratricopeptide (TPR) repeat protein